MTSCERGNKQFSSREIDAIIVAYYDVKDFVFSKINTEENGKAVLIEPVRDTNSYSYFDTGEKLEKYESIRAKYEDNNHKSTAVSLYNSNFFISNTAAIPDIISYHLSLSIATTI